MANNHMDLVAKVLGVELGEKFIVKNSERIEEVVLYKGGLLVCSNGEEVYNPKLLTKILCGVYEIERKPWEPRNSEKYWCLYVDRWNNYFSIHSYTWNGDIDDFLRLRAGIIYRKKEDAEANIAGDYERLTGKPLEGK